MNLNGRRTSGNVDDRRGQRISGKAAGGLGWSLNRSVGVLLYHHSVGARVLEGQFCIYSA